MKEFRSPSHATRRDARIGDSRGGHVARSPGKGGGPASVSRPDNTPVQGGSGATELEKSLNEGLARTDRR